ncbi:hypothetical protein P886_0654 [Alteromonadaceae bacterium 2753L.S.0a.02]|nr:hypothetical protein P886_0654 [Alteromonadaceae bacterium 2753L.S.0a.02]
MRCFKAVQHWQRRELKFALRQALRPQLPDFLDRQVHSPANRVLRGVFIVLSSPLILLSWLARSLAQLCLFPYRYALTLILPKGLYAPGERNLQGIHRAFSPYHNLSIPFYLKCVNDWVLILYGLEASRHHKIETHIYSQTSTTLKEFQAYPTRQSVSMARESLSRALGYY